MYNLGLGGLEFNVTHTIEEHHPDGYKIPDLEDDINLLNDNNENNSDNSQENIKIEFESNTNKNNEDSPNIQNIEIYDSTNNIMNLDQAEINENEMNFRKMHDPKHRHPRHHNSKLY